MARKTARKKEDEWKRLNEIFDVATELPTGERRAFLDRECGEDSDLRIRAERLISAARKNGTSKFMTGDAFAVGARVLASDSRLASVEGRHIGPYRLVSEISHGGMGVVYLAERDEFQQRVALKLIRSGLDSTEILRRFRVERDVLASLDHPNIARLLDGGTTDDGLPFLAMEYVDGQPIDRYCLSRKLSIDDTLRLFQKVCGAVSYAHQNLTVHRDIKPSNILVNEAGEPKLLDFGISKILSPDKTTQADTATADRLLTPEYASPEQLMGEKLSTSSDVYSLGVLLYELLTGHRPFEMRNQSPFEIFEAVCKTEPPAPSSWRDLDPKRVGDTEGADASTADTPPRFTASQLRGDLDNIILTALRKDPERRYSSVEQFSEDIRRHLVGLPVYARPATLKYRAVKFVRRNRASVAFATIAAAALLIGTGVASWQAVVARKEKAIAEKRFNEVRSLANTFVNDWDKGLNEENITPEIRGRLADISSDYLTRLATESDDPELLRETADAHIKLGHAYAYFMIDADKARQSFLTANQIARRLIDIDANDRVARSLLILSLLKYDEFFGSEDLEGFVTRKAEQIVLREKNIAENPEDAAELRHLALAHEHLAGTFINLGRAEEARPHHLLAHELHGRRIEILERAEPTSKNLARLSYALTDRAFNLGRNLGDLQSSISSMRRAVTVANESLRAPESDRSARMAVIDSYQELAAALGRAGEYEAAISELNAGLLADRGFPENSVDGYFKRRETDFLTAIALNQHYLGRDSEASKRIHEAFDLSRAWATKESKRSPLISYRGHAFVLEFGARVLAMAGRFDEARMALDEAEEYVNRIPVDSKHRGPIGQLLVVVMISRGDLYAGIMGCRISLEIDLDESCVARSITKSPQRKAQAAQTYQRLIEFVQALPADIQSTHSDLKHAKAAARRLELLK